MPKYVLSIFDTKGICIFQDVSANIDLTDSGGVKSLEGSLALPIPDASKLEIGSTYNIFSKDGRSGVMIVVNMRVCSKHHSVDIDFELSGKF